MDEKVSRSDIYQIMKTTHVIEKDIHCMEVPYAANTDVEQ